MPQAQPAAKSSKPVPPAGKLPVEVYSPAARHFHWLVVAMMLIQFPIGFGMVYRGGTLKIWDSVTNNLYSSHKLLGVVLLAVAVLRLVYRLVHGAPAHEPTLKAWHRILSAINHWGVYALLLVVPALGWLGVSMFPALELFGLFSLPSLAAPNKPLAEIVFQYHGIAAFALLGLIGVHVLAALYHHLIRGDNVLARMIPRLMR